MPAIAVHHTATVDEAWDGPAAVAAMPSDDAVLRYCHAWQTDEAANEDHKSGDDDADDKKSSYKFPHHKSKGGPANLAACRNGLARLEGSKIPDGDKAGVKAHLQAHLDDAEKKSGDSKSSSDSAKASAARRRTAVAQLEGNVRQGVAGQTWYRIQNLVQNPGTACVYLYGEIGMWGIESDQFVQELQDVNASQIDVHINSMGGDVFEGIAILNALRAHPANVTTYVDSLAASIASIVAMGGDKVVMAPNSTLMIHDAHAIGVGNAADMTAMVALLDKTSDNMASVYASKAGGDPAEWRALMRAETWFSAEEAVAAGLADEVAGATDDEGDGSDDDVQVSQAMSATYDLSVFRYPGRGAAPAPPVPALAASTTATEPPAEPAPEAEAEPEEPEEPDTQPPAPLAASGTNQWAVLTSGLLSNATPSTVDELFAALQKGIPA